MFDIALKRAKKKFLNEKSLPKGSAIDNGGGGSAMPPPSDSGGGGMPPDPSGGGGGMGGGMPPDPSGGGAPPGTDMNADSKKKLEPHKTAEESLKNLVNSVKPNDMENFLTHFGSGMDEVDKDKFIALYSKLYKVIKKIIDNIPAEPSTSDSTEVIDGPGN